MSGIIGIFYFDGQPVETGMLAHLANAAPWRGPDGLFIWTTTHVGLALQFWRETPTMPEPAQPYCDPHSLVLVADCRLDNRFELLKLLEMNDTEPSLKATDAALLAAAYHHWGVAMIDHIEGAFAIALWDISQKKLLLFRDRVGERTLYWTRLPGGLAFASEPAQLTSLLPDGRCLRRETLLAYLLNTAYPPDWSFYEGVQRLPGGALLTANEQSVQVKTWWSYEQLHVPAPRSAEIPIHLRTSLVASVANRLPDAGTLGVLLSSGMDSSSITALAAQQMATDNQQVLALSWASTSQDIYDERLWSQALIERYPNIHEIPLPADDLFPFSNFPKGWDDPNEPEATIYPELTLSSLETLRQAGAQSVFSGAGGDQVFGGYQPDILLLKSGQFAALLKRWRKPATAWLHLHALFKTLRPRRLPAWLSEFGHTLVSQYNLDAPNLRLTDLENPFKARLALLQQPAWFITPDRFDRISHRTNLRYSAPWLDPALTTLALSLPDAGLEMAPPGKVWLRKAVSTDLPTSLLAPGPRRGVGARLRWRGYQVRRELLSRWLVAPRLAALELVEPTSLRSTYQATTENRHSVSIDRAMRLEAWLRCVDFQL